MDCLAIYFFLIHWLFVGCKSVKFDVGGCEEIAMGDHELADVEREFGNLCSDAVEEG